MMMLTRQNLLADKTRFAISVGGIALAVFLMSFYMSLYQGWRLGVGRFVDNVDTDIWVARDGSTDFLGAGSLLPADMKSQLAALPNVAKVDAVIVRPMDLVIDGKKETTHIVGYEVNGAGAPPKVTKGDDTPGANEIIMDHAFLHKSGLSIGDEVQIGGQAVKVVGESSGGNLIFSQTSFLTIDEARTLLNMPNLTTFYLLKAQDSVDTDTVIQEVETTIPGVGAYTTQEFANATRARIMDNLLPILFVILGLSFIVGVAITGMTIYNTTVEKAREFGILKAMGFTNGYLFRLVVEQSLLTGVLGFAIGTIATVTAGQFVVDFVPQFVTLVRFSDIGLVLIATALMSSFAAVLPLRRIVSVDPVSVFSG